jgi:hypothetical protein
MDGEASGMAVCGRGSVCCQWPRSAERMVRRDRLGKEVVSACEEAHESAGVVGGRGVIESGCRISWEPCEDERWRTQAHFRRG